MELYELVAQLQTTISELAMKVGAIEEAMVKSGATVESDPSRVPVIITGTLPVAGA